MEENELEEKLHDKIKQGNELIKRLDNFTKISGSGKLSRKIQKELQFLHKFKENPKKLKVEHLQCSNLLHLSAIVQALEDSQKPIHVLKTFENSQNRKVIVDIIAQEGFQWVKVIARSPQALERLSIGDQAYGQRSLIDQAKDYLQAAEVNLHHFKPPQLIFVFHAGVPENAANKLSNLGIQVQGEIVPNSIEEEYESDEDEQENQAQNYQDVDYSTLNLDITAMIAYVSALTNGNTNCTFQEKILNQQAEWEKKKPVKPILEELFHDKKLITCQSAMNDFLSILQTLGGEMPRKNRQLFNKYRTLTIE